MGHMLRKMFDYVWVPNTTSNHNPICYCYLFLPIQFLKLFRAGSSGFKPEVNEQLGRLSQGQTKQGMDDQPRSRNMKDVQVQ